MKTLLLAVLVLALSACGTLSTLTPGVTSEAYSKAVKACSNDGGVRMVTQTIGIDYDVFCSNGNKYQL